jgi:hypothetical protein
MLVHFLGGTKLSIDICMTGDFYIQTVILLLVSKNLQQRWNVQRLRIVKLFVCHLQTQSFRKDLKNKEELLQNFWVNATMLDIQ